MELVLALFLLIRNYPENLEISFIFKINIKLNLFLKKVIILILILRVVSKTKFKKLKIILKKATLLIIIKDL